MLHFNTSQCSVVFGAPGTGKTSYLLGQIEELLYQGVASSDVALFTFSKGAIHEARTRLNLPMAETPWWRTLHSCAFKLLGLRRDQVLTDLNLRHFNEVTGYRVQRQHIGFRPSEVNPVRPHWSNEAMFLMMSARALQLPLEQHYEHAGPLGRVRLCDAVQFQQDYEQYKKVYGLYDFADMLEQCQAELPTNVRYLFIDEAQDLTPQQWAFAQRLSTNVERIMIVGDDDQTVYGFAGAYAHTIVDYAKAHPEQVLTLGHSHRLPVNILKVSQQVAQRIASRVDKHIQPKYGDPGVIRFFTGIVDLPVVNGGDWLILARHKYQLRKIASYLTFIGCVFWYNGAWSDYAPEVRAILAWQRFQSTGQEPDHGDKRVMSKFRSLRWPVPLFLRQQPWHQVFNQIPLAFGEYCDRIIKYGELDQRRIRLMTIHECKGAEANHVALFTDYSLAVRRSISSPESTDEHQDELRILYVALTRAQHALYIQSAGQRDSYMTTLLRGVKW